MMSILLDPRGARSSRFNRTGRACVASVAQAAPSLEKLKRAFEAAYPEHLAWGVHVMVCQNERGELTVGDTHEYGLTHEPFDRAFLNDMVLQYLKVGGLSCAIVDAQLLYAAPRHLLCVVGGYGRIWAGISLYGFSLWVHSGLTKGPARRVLRGSTMRRSLRSVHRT
jgi:hypothetical protein